MGTPDGTDQKFRCYAADMLHNVVRPVCPERTPESIVRASPDGKWALAEAPGGVHFVAYPIAGGEPKPVQGVTAPAEDVVGWRADSKSVYVAARTNNDKKLVISVVDLDTGKRTPFAEIHPMRPMNSELNFYITPDGRTYVYNYGVRLSDLYLASGLQ